ncbi:flagellar export chaperone FlgN, partial [Escherichia coli O8:H10]
MSSKLEQVKLLLRGVRTDGERYRQLHSLLEEQRLCMIRRASDALIAVNADIERLYPLLSSSARLRRETLLSLGVTADDTGMQQVFSWLPTVQHTAARQAWQQL